MKRVVRGSRGTAQDLINALNSRIDDIQDGTVASTEVTAMKSAFNRDAIRSQVEDYLGEYVKDYDVDGIVDDISDFEVEDGSYVSNIDQIDPDEFQYVVRSHERNVAACSVSGATDDVEYLYSIEDTHGTPQAGIEVLDFETWEELQEYLDENPDVQTRIEEGYATIKEL